MCTQLNMHKSSYITTKPCKSRVSLHDFISRRKNTSERHFPKYDCDSIECQISFLFTSHTLDIDDHTQVTFSYEIYERGFRRVPYMHGRKMIIK